MTVDAEARVMRRVVRVGLLLALLGQIAWSFRPAPTRAQTDQQRLGRALYETSCSTCHGLDAAVHAGADGRPGHAVPLGDPVGGIAAGGGEVAARIERRPASIVEDSEGHDVAGHPRAEG